MGRKATPEYNLAVIYPDVVRHWHPSKNGLLVPQNVTPKCHRKVWWKCEEGHEWETSVQSRTSVEGCPVCYKDNLLKKRRAIAIKKSGSLLEKYPELFAQLHPKKNSGITLEELPTKTNQKVWWVCKKKHAYFSSVSSRTSDGSGCRICGIERSKRGIVNSAIKRSGTIEDNYPELISQWHATKNGLLKPKDFSVGSKQKIWWMCNRGHEWETHIKVRVKGHGCPKCFSQTSRLEVRLYCELKGLLGDVDWRKKINNIECDVFIPAYKTAIELDGYFWHKDKRKRDKKKGEQLRKEGVTLFRIRDKRLGEIDGNSILFHEGQDHIQIINNLLGKLINMVNFSVDDLSNIKNYLSNNELRMENEYNEIIAILPSPPIEKSFGNTFPELVSEWDDRKNQPLTPYLFTPHTHQKVWWVCKVCANNYFSSISHRSNGRGCPKCAQSTRIKGVRSSAIKRSGSLADKHPDIVIQWHPTKNGLLKPKDFSVGSKQKIWWICKNGHEWLADINGRVRGRGCLKCCSDLRGINFRKSRSKYNNLLKDFPEIAKEWHATKNEGLSPKDFPPKSSKKIWWTCKNGHEWQTKISTRTQGSNCPHCWKERRKSKNGNKTKKT
jgi:hypothetical protein